MSLQRLPAGALYSLAGLTVALAAAAGAAGAGDGGDLAAAFQGAIAGVAAVLLAAGALVVRPAWSLSLGLVLSAFSGYWGELGAPMPMDRLLIASGVVSTLVREWRANGRLRTRPIDWMLMLVAAYAICSAALAGTLQEASPRFNLIDRFSLTAFVLFFVAPLAFRERRDREILLWMFVGLGAYLGVTALIETVGPRSILFPRYIDDPSVGIHFDRARGPFVEAAANGMILFACAIFTAIAALNWRNPRLRRIALAVIALCMLGTLLTVTRAVWIGAVAGTVAGLFAARETRRFLPVVILAGGVGVLFAFAAIPGLQSQAKERTDKDRPLWARKHSNAAALRMIAEKPTLGFGWGTYRTEARSYFRQADDYPLVFVRDVHNLYLGNAVELGLLGAGLWLFAFVWAIGGAITRRGPPELRPWRIGLLAFTCMYLTLAATTPLSFTSPNILIWAWAGICWGPAPARTEVAT